MSDTGPTAIPRRLFVYLRALVRFAAFVVVGPLIGWLMGVVAILVRGGSEHFLHDLPLSLIFGYAMGAIPAAAVGFVIAVCDVLGRPQTVFFAAALGAIVGLVWGVYIAVIGDESWHFGILVLAASIVGSVVCWRLTRRLSREAMG